MRQLAAILPILLLLVTSPAAADDTVFVRSARGGETRLTGQVLDYDGQTLSFQTVDGQQRAIPTERVIRVETRYTPQHVQARRAAAEGHPETALPLYQQVLRDEPRRWVRRRILQEMIGCYRSLGQIDQAGNLFLLLARDRPGVDDFACMPLAWSPGAPSAAIEKTAREWMAHEDLPAAVLLGASHLLSTDRAGAVARLKRLAVDADGPVAQLAAAQLWRTDVVTATPVQTDAWHRAIERMPLPLQAGPYFVLGRALARQGRTDEAALALLRAPILYPNDRALAAEGLLDAGRALEQLGRPRQAARLYRELLQQHASSREATEARKRWEALTKNQP